MLNRSWLFVLTAAGAMLNANAACADEASHAWHYDQDSDTIVYDIPGSREGVRPTGYTELTRSLFVDDGPESVASSSADRQAEYTAGVSKYSGSFYVDEDPETL